MKAVLLCLLWSLVEVHSQTVPYVAFMGEDLPNHSYVDLTLVGEDDSDPGNIVRCHTDLSTCCTNSQGTDRGDWYFPNETRLRFTMVDYSIYENRAAQQVTLHRRHNATGPSGIYRCEVPTIASSPVREMVYVGLYASEGNDIPDLCPPAFLLCI